VAVHVTERERELLEFLRPYFQQLPYGRMVVALTIHESEPIDVEIPEMKPRRKLLGIKA
jgi:hypothetical protein